jgi:hypothetical protein
MVVEALAYVGLFSVLGAVFDYPAILREPAGEVLSRFAAGGPSLVGIWYALALTALLFLPIAIILPWALDRDDPTDRPTVGFTAVLGILAALVQTLGLARWVFVVPFLALTYVEPGTSAATRDAVLVVFEALHRYLGAAVGEHLGYLLTGCWTLLVSARMLAAPGFGKAFAFPGFLAGFGVMVGLLEPAGLAFAGVVNAAGYMLWSVWLAAAGIRLVLGVRAQPIAAAPADMAASPAVA